MTDRQTIHPALFMQRGFYAAAVLLATLSIVGVQCSSTQNTPDKASEKQGPVSESASSERSAGNPSASTGTSETGEGNAEAERSVVEQIRESLLPGQTGCVRGDCKDGEGVFVYGTGDIYVGRFQEGKRQGRGAFDYANGDKFEGNFKSNQRNGFGSYTFANGDKYVGEFTAGRLQGIGTYRFSDGTQLKGTFDDNGTNGDGIFIEDETQTNEQGRDCTVENRQVICRN